MKIIYVSVYLIPNERIDEFQTKLDSLEDALRNVQGDLVVVGDFNAKPLEWGEARPDSRGGRVMDMLSRLRLVVLNIGSTRTFRRNGHRQTIPDITLANEHLAARITGWHVIEDFTGSDHQFITFGVRDVRIESPRVQPTRWCIGRIDHDKFSSALERDQQSLVAFPENLSLSERAERMTAITMLVIQNACAQSVPRPPLIGPYRRPPQELPYAPPPDAEG